MKTAFESLHSAAKDSRVMRQPTQAGFVNRNLLRTFSAMLAHKSQARWWKHVLTKRYTMVNVYHRMASSDLH